MKAELYEFYKLPFRRLHSYIFQCITDRKLTAVYHAHDFYELIWVRRGWARQTVNGEELCLKEGAAVMLRPGDAHGFLAQAAELSVVSLSVKKEEFELLAGAYAPALSGHISRAKEVPAFPLPPFWGEVSGDTEFDCKYLLSFFLRAYITGTGFTEAAECIPPWLQKLAEQMRGHENLRQGVAAATALSHYSRGHLARLIRAHLGVGLKEWINELRLQAAYADLILTEKTMAEISEEVGFASFSHFYKIFKSKFGVTPAALRKHKRILTV